MIEIAAKAFNGFIGLGGAAMMFFILTILALFFGVSLRNAIEGGLRMAIALTGMSAVVSLLTTSFSPALTSFAQATGTGLEIVDLGWAPLAVITWGSLYTLYFACICTVLNLVFLFLNLTNTLIVDLFNIWNISIAGLILHYYSHNIVITSIFVLGIYALMLRNADLIKPSVDRMLGFDKDNAVITAHPCVLIAPFVMVLNRVIDVCLPFVDKFDFDAETLNKKIGFFGSRIAIGVYVGLFIGTLGRLPFADVIKLAFTGGAVMELFAIVGGWFGPAIKPIADGIQNIAEKYLHGRRLYIAIDWPFLGARAELWTTVNLLAPIILLIALVLPGNRVMPLGGILLTALMPAVLLVADGRILRMMLLSICMTPVYLLSATYTAECFTNLSIAMNSLPDNLGNGQMFSSLTSLPISRMLARFLGESVADGNVAGLLGSVAFVIFYLFLFRWYAKKMRKRDVACYNRGDSV
ncbi:MAG: PTS glucitol transporter subunit IIA [Lachnospiraceae bacterium]|nr:PTS glucitol transporter subunit IIA [Lachnospiraceae bacterium]